MPRARTHLQLRTRGFAACVEPTVANYGTLRLTDDRNKVDCLRCLRWMSDRDALEARRPRRPLAVPEGVDGAAS